MAHFENVGVNFVGENSVGETVPPPQTKPGRLGDCDQSNVVGPLPQEVSTCGEYHLNI